MITEYFQKSRSVVEQSWRSACDGFIAWCEHGVAGRRVVQTFKELGFNKKTTKRGQVKLLEYFVEVNLCVDLFWPAVVFKIHQRILG